MTIIFDLDGTLWDATNATYKAANIVSKRNGLNEVTMETVINGMGQTREHNSKLYFPDAKQEEAVKMLDDVCEETTKLINNGEANLYPNVDKALSQLSNKFDLYIVSNSGNVLYVEAIKKYVNCTFKETIAAGALGMNKVEGIRHIMNKNKIIDAIYVGDTEIDQSAATELNIPFIYAKYGFGNLKNCTYEINSMLDLESEILKIYTN